MNAQVLEQKIVAKDRSAIALAGELGANAEGVLEKLATNPDAEVRELDMKAINAAGGPSRNRMLIAALGDADVNVRSEAMRGLEKWADETDVMALQMQLAGNADPYIRGEVALVLGRIMKRGDTTFLERRRELEKDGDANHKIVLALARLGDGGARAIQRKKLASGDPEVRLEAVREYEYINDPAALVDLKPALGDVTDVFNINPPHAKPRMMRLCDVAVNVVAKVGKVKLSFDGTERKRFEAEQIAEVVRVVG